MGRRVAAAVVVALLAVAVGATSAGAQAPPQLRARSALLLEASTGDVAVARAAQVRRPIASATKLMTALVAVERLRLGRVVAAAPYDAQPVESQLGLRTGERMRVSDLLRALLLESANDAAATLAVGASGSVPAFVAAMNRRARELGLRDTRFANPIGLDDPRNFSSAADLARLAIEVRRDPFLRRVVDLPRARLRSGDRQRTVRNRNSLVRTVPVVNGVKTGRTSRAGYVLVGSATRDGVTVMSVVLGEPSEAARDADSLALLRHGLRRYRRATALRRGQVLARADAPLAGGPVALTAAATVRRVVRRGERLRVEVREVPERLEGPLPRGSRAGTAVVRHRDRVVARVPLVTARELPAPSLAARAGEALRDASIILLAGLVAACSLSLVVLHRRAARRRAAQRRRRRGRLRDSEERVA
jgi:D-alanyl-D-alanine carboxypeptidase (penicillin-binding protein 5/6)